MTRGALAERYGVRRHPAYGWDVIEIPTSPAIAPGLTSPLNAQQLPAFSPHVPAARFSAVAWLSPDARENLRRTAEHFAERLGEAPIADRNNTAQCEWRSAAASLTLLAWPAELQRHRLVNPAHDRDPRLAIGCHIEVLTGYRPPVSPEEQAWLDSFQPAARFHFGPNARADIAATAPASENELEFVREPPVHFNRYVGRIGLSADGRALIFCGEQLYLIPMSQVTGLFVERVLPAKGPGGSDLIVLCRADYPEYPIKRLHVCSSGATDGLDDFATSLAATLDKPVELAEPYPNY
jgi:hypothetical protein